MGRYESMDGDRGSEVGTVGSIDLRGGESAVDLTGQIHQLPCCIKYDGPCSVSHYFKPKSTGNINIISSFPEIYIYIIDV